MTAEDLKGKYVEFKRSFMEDGKNPQIDRGWITHVSAENDKLGMTTHIIVDCDNDYGGEADIQFSDVTKFLPFVSKEDQQKRRHERYASER